MLGALKSLTRKKRRCGACLFELSSKAKPLDTDLHRDWMYIFATCDWHDFTFESLEASAKRGCETCVALIGALKQFGTTFTTASWIPDRNPFGGRHPILQIENSKERFELLTSDRVVDKGVPSLHPVVNRGRKLSGSTGGHLAMSQVIKWLDECRQNHEGCSVRDHWFVPTRLIYVGGEDPDVVELIENPEPSTVYAALSHRWTQETIAVRLETSNLSRRKQKGIRISEFPQMMQDVISVLRQLEIQHVWIDCMCIIQDDKEDWQREALTMASIYANAELTVAATGCNSSGQSLFRSRGGPDQLAIDIARINGQAVFIRRALPHFTWADIEQAWFAGHEWIDAEVEWPLLSRGWVYQEQLLSRRMLHFTRNEVLWECYDMTKCECGWHENDRNTTSDSSEWNKRPSAAKEWKQIVQEYAKRPLTYYSDRLPALAGIAKDIAKFTGEDPKNYVCGLWTNDLHTGFFWYLSEPPTGLRIDSKMPTWSWASVVGLIEFWSSLREDVEFLDCKAEFHGDAFMGDVENASITVSGLVVPATVHHGQDWIDVVSSLAVEVEEDSSLFAVGDNTDIFGLKLGEQVVTIHPDYKLDIPGESFIASGTPVMCLLMEETHSGSYDPETNISTDRANACCLVLRCVDDEKMLYERIGVCKGSGSTDDNWLSLEVFISLSKKEKLIVV
ncbi:hypothetical protein PT974_02527 [Cladobotryum mycophilum]|uniref:Heterokaryon incompatibility domain-containing protein n=1 Tax=Cladobotryum mycophilum TaxID=491253 RepID=A0ABR0SYV0_9HYPO